MATATDAPTRVGFTEAEPARPTKMTVNRERRLFAGAGFAMLVLTAVGFRQFILHGRAIGGVPMTPQIVALVVMHGLAMLGWVVLFCVQSTLIVANRQRLHIVLGKVGAWLAGAIVILGLAVAPLSVHYNPAAYDDFGGARYFLALMWPEPLTFGVLVAVALAYRYRPEVHRPMMLLATAGLMTGPLTRWPYWDTAVRFGAGSVAAAMFGQMLALGAILLVVHATITRRMNPYFLAGYSGQVVVSVLSAVVANSATWNQLAALVVR